MQLITIYNDDCVAVIQSLPTGSFDAVITDPPYLIGFQNNKWDVADSIEDFHMHWLKEVYEKMSPGNVIKAFSATRTFHRLCSAMDKVGFQDIQVKAWGFSQGFPHNYDVAKNLLKKAQKDPKNKEKYLSLAKVYEGYGNTLKTCFEPYCCAVR